MTNRIYLGIFTDWDSVMRYFNVKPQLQEPNYVYAFYDIEYYSGEAFVIYSDDGETFKFVAGSHCSCYGLENQWEPETYSASEFIGLVKDAMRYEIPIKQTPHVLAWLAEVAR